MPADTIQHFYALALGLACSGFLSTGFKLLTDRPASFRLLNGGPGRATFAAIPFLIFAAPFIIIRHTICVGRASQQRFQAALVATMVAGFWSLMSGTVILSALIALRG